MNECLADAAARRLMVVIIYPLRHSIKSDPIGTDRIVSDGATDIRSLAASNAKFSPLLN